MATGMCVWTTALGFESHLSQTFLDSIFPFFSIWDIFPKENDLFSQMRDFLGIEESFASLLEIEYFCRYRLFSARIQIDTKISASSFPKLI